MPDETVLKDGAQDTSPEPVQPKPTFDETSGDQRSDADPLGRLEQSWNEKFERLRRDIQSNVDKGLGRVEKKLDSMSVLGEYKKLLADGYSEREAEQELRLRNMEQGTQPTAQTVPGRTESGETTPDSEVAQEIKRLRLDPGQPEVVKLLRGHYRNMDHFKASAVELKLNLSQSAAPSSSAAPVAQSTSTVRTSEEEREAIGAKLVDLQREPTKNKDEIKRLREQLKGGTAS